MGESIMEQVALTFTVSTEENERSKPFIAEHQQKHDEYQGSIGGRYSYKFCSTSLGVAVSIHCSCGESLNLTDYSEW
jgi:hypothetical protein